MLGQVKACIVVLGGWLLFEQVYPASSLLGAALAASAIISYTAITIREQERAKQLVKADEHEARSPKVSTRARRIGAGCTQV